MSWLAWEVKCLFNMVKQVLFHSWGWDISFFAGNKTVSPPFRVHPAKPNAAGGVGALVGAIIAGPRTGRFERPDEFGAAAEGGGKVTFNMKPRKNRLPTRHPPKNTKHNTSENWTFFFFPGRFVIFLECLNKLTPWKRMVKCWKDVISVCNCKTKLSKPASAICWLGYLFNFSQI